MASVPSLPGRSTPTEPLWASGRFVLRAHGVGSNWWRDITIRRPHALVGRLAGAEVRIDDPEVEERHVYLHLDRRGLFAVDLASRTGSRIGPQERSAAWLKPGDALEVAGRRIELIRLELDGPTRLEPTGEDPLGDSGDRPRVRLALFPERGAGAPMVLNSELVFVGRSEACGVRIRGENAATVHGVLVRGERTAHVVNLLGRDSWLNGRPLREAATLRDGDVLALGDSRFECRVQPAGSEAAFPALRAETPPAARGDAWSGTEVVPGASLPIPATAPIGQEPAQLLAWMMGVLQATQGEMLRRQAAFQRELVEAIERSRTEGAETLSQQLGRMDDLRDELARLRDEVRQRFGPSNAPARPRLPKAPPLSIQANAQVPEDPEAAAAWLLNRVGRIDQESRASWRDLLGRIGRAEK